MAKSKGFPRWSVAAENGLNLRTAPGGQVLAVLPHGLRLDVLARKNGWAQVRAGRLRGWVMGEYLRGEAVEDAGTDPAPPA